MGKSVYLSPSTQEHNMGVVGYGTEESRMNAIADVIEKILKRHDITVYRNKPEWPLSQVVADSNSKKPNIHFAIHSNANDGKSRGGEVFCHRFGSEGEKLARKIYDELAPLTPSTDRGIKEGYNRFGPGKPLYELANTNAPAALVEIAFHDNVDDAKWILSHIEIIGIALAKGILKYLSIPYKEDITGLESDIEVLYKYGILQSRDYWRQNAVKGKTVAGENAAILIQRVAAILLKGGI